MSQAIRNKSITDTKTARQRAIQFLKITLSAAIIAYLVWDSLRRGEGVFSDEHGFNAAKFWQIIHHARQNWLYLVAAFVTTTSGVFITFFRWWVLMRTVRVPLKLTESLRLSFIGFLLNLAPMGLVGGDLAKAILAARRFPDHRPETVASVFVDRVLGLYALFLVATGAIIFTGTPSSPSVLLQHVSRIVVFVTAGATLLLVASWAPDITGGNLIRWCERLPVVGKLLAKFVTAFRAYRHHPEILFGSVLVTLPVHLMFALSIYFIGLGLFEHVHTLARHFVFCPLAATMQMIPMSIGPAEFVLDRLFVMVPLESGEKILPGQGLVVLLVYRFFSLLLGIGGLIYFLSTPEEWKQVLHEAEEARDWEMEATSVVPKP